MQTRFFATLAATSLLAGLGLSAQAQVPNPPPAPPAVHRGLGNIFHRPLHHGPMMQPGRRMLPLSGGIIGNKNTHVYHLAGDKGSLPSPANRVYFRTEAQAMAAGYRKAGSGAKKSGLGQRGQMRGSFGRGTVAH